MNKQKRILAVCSSIDQLDTLIAKCAELSERYDAGVTLLYVKEENLFELPFFSESDGSVESIRQLLSKKIRESGHEEWAVLAFENDLVDHVRLEASREESFLIVSDEHDELDELAALGRALLSLKGGTVHRYKKVLIALDSAFSGEQGLDFTFGFAPGAHFSCYMDYQLIMSMEDPSLDPVVGAMTPEVLMSEESDVIEIRKRAFENLCREKGLDGSFEVGEYGLVEDVMERVKISEPDLLAIVAEDRDTLMAEAARDLVKKVPMDLLFVLNES